MLEHPFFAVHLQLDIIYRFESKDDVITIKYHHE